MKFTYQELQNKVGDKVGIYRGHPVYSVNVHAYINLNEHSDAYLIYDNGNILVVGELAIGRIKENGAIDYFRTSIDYNEYLEARGLPILEKQSVKVEVAPSTSMFETSEIPTDVPTPIDFDVSELTVDLDLSSSELVESLLNSVFEG